MRTTLNWCLLFALMVTLTACGDDDGNVPITPPTKGLQIPETGATSPRSYDGMTLVWEEEFEGTSLNAGSWTHETGTGNNGWGNNEEQYYRPENTSLVDGHLVIEAKKESFGGKEYTSSRIITKDKHSFQFGRIDIRAALPEGKGMWPALWMLGSNFEQVGWPACGEIDIMEKVGGAGIENEIHGTVHWQDPAVNNPPLNHAEAGGSVNLSSDTKDEFHVYSITWDENQIRWYVDNREYHRIDIRPADLSELREEFFFIVNLAVGGNWPGSPNQLTTFPQYFIVDYIRVFQDN